MSRDNATAMSEREAAEALETLGLSNYEAQVFVTLQRLGGGTAQGVSRHSEVPRSQVYGAADDLAERGLLEVIESSPKTYRPVELSTARQLLTERLERETTRAFDTLEELRASDRSPTGGDVATLRGRRPIDDRIATLVADADSTVVFVSPTAESLAETIATALRDAASSGVSVTVVTAEPSLRDRFAGTEIDVFVMSEDNPADFAGRALMVDDRTVLLAAETDSSPVEEEALWTGDSSIGRILAAFMRSGMESGRERHRGGPSGHERQ
ncbi:TrmB family transcriptional regulator [Halapricum hydrolyticum]|uniref:TrmB family transcriptional regulator n=1 Tax=Halapricum hydrolyticum TaxID=2979991 RepID=A0AAE3IER9_9EURY|nr:helix-turn-helix domain-containing protein [Halapricum hydrolyticum]MCU4718949.1 TrmB family transcriptional regulator [Halapricum hydrolyticum]MCU4727958.1 TrmB family transcriptional regulator [Halapricum hydrolyticum]